MRPVARGNLDSSYVARNINRLAPPIYDLFRSGQAAVRPGDGPSATLQCVLRLNPAAQRGIAERRRRLDDGLTQGIGKQPVVSAVGSRGNRNLGRLLPPLRRVQDDHTSR